MKIVILPVAVLLALTAGIAAQTPPRFRFERDVQVAGPGANRLDVDVPVLVGAHPGLGDLRFFDPAGREVGYLLIAPPPVAPVWVAGLVSPIASVKTETSETSGFEAPDVSTCVVEFAKTLSYPKSTQGKFTRFAYPFEFKPN